MENTFHRQKTKEFLIMEFARSNQSVKTEARTYVSSVLKVFEDFYKNESEKLFEEAWKDYTPEYALKLAIDNVYNGNDIFPEKSSYHKVITGFKLFEDLDPSSFNRLWNQAYDEYR
jgi:hypothetical protein